MAKQTGRKKDSEEGPNGDFNRRDFLRKSTTTTLAGSVGLSGHAAASNSGDGEGIVETKLTNISEEEVEEVLSADVVSQIINDVKGVTPKVEEANKISVSTKSEEIGHLIKLPAGIGTLSIIHEDGEPVQADLELDRENLHPATEAKINAVKSWPSGTTGRLRTTKLTDGIQFSRTLNKTEEKSLRELTGLNDGAVSMAAKYRLPNTVAGRSEVTYLVVQQPKYYKIRESSQSRRHSRDRRKKIVESGTIDNSEGISILRTTCEKKAGGCLGDILMAFPGCGVSMAACGITGPVTAACVVAVLAICGPELGLVAVSGRCGYVANNCL